VLGYKQTLKTLRNGKSKLVIIASNTPPLRCLFNALPLLVTCRDVSSPPCRRVADSSRHLCGWPSVCCFISVIPCGLPPLLLFSLSFFTTNHLLFSYYVVLNFITLYHQQFSFQSHFSVLYHLWHTSLSL
jgi:hypothetical protein